MGSLMNGATVRLYKNGSATPAVTQTTTVPVSYGIYSYSFTGLETDQDYQVTVEKAGVSFIPNELGTGTLGVKNFKKLLTQAEQDFATNENTKTISGNIHTNTIPPVGIANVNVKIVSSIFTTSAVTGSDGTFQTTVPSTVEYILTPSDVPDLGYSFVNADSTGRTSKIYRNCYR